MCRSCPGKGRRRRTFRVTPKYTFDPKLPAAKWSLAVAEPVSERTLDTDRIAVVTNGIGVDYVALAFWVDRAPAMVQTLIVQSFRNSGRVDQVGTNRDRVRPDFQLVSDLRAFQLNRGGSGSRCRAGPSQRAAPAHAAPRLRRRESFANELAPAGDGIDAVVAAFDEALGKVLKELVAWTVRTGNRAGV